MLYSLIIPVCQPLGTIENYCQSLCLLRHHSPEETLGTAWLPQDQPTPSSSNSSEQLFIPAECGLVVKGEGRRQGDRICGLCLCYCDWTTAALALTPDLWLSFISFRIGKMLITYSVIRSLWIECFSYSGLQSSNRYPVTLFLSDFHTLGCKALTNMLLLHFWVIFILWVAKQSQPSN